MFEPRGAIHHNANILVSSNNPEAQMGYIILESMEYPAMSGSNTMCGHGAPRDRDSSDVGADDRIDPRIAGRADQVTCDCRDGKVERVRFVNQPAFCCYLDTTVDVPGIGKLMVDVVYGGMTYVIVEAARLGFKLEPSEARALCELGQAIKRAAAEQIEVTHPEADTWLRQLDDLPPVRSAAE